MIKSYLNFKSKILNSFEKKVLEGAGIAFVIKVLGAGTSFGLQVALARLLSLEAYGSYTYIMAWVGMISGFTTLGFSTSIIRFIPEYLKEGDFAKLKGVIKTSLFVTLGCSVFFATIGLVILSFLNSEADYSYNIYLYASGIFLGLSLVKIFGSIEKGKKQMFMAHAPSQLFRHMFIGAGVLCLWLIQGNIGLVDAIVSTLGAAGLLVLLHLFFVNKQLPKSIFLGKTTYQFKKWIKISFPLLLISGFSLILNRTDIIMLGFFSTKAQVGVYNVAQKVALLTSFVLVAVNSIAAPTISELYHQGKMEELQQFARKIAHLIFWPTVLISVGLVIFSGFILGLFGKEFVNGKSLLIILLIGQLVNGCVGSVGYYLNMTGYERDSAKIFGITAIVNILINPVGIYFYGAVGAAVVTALTTSIWNIWLYFVVKNRVGIKSSII